MAIQEMILDTGSTADINDTLEADSAINLSNKGLLISILTELKVMNYYLHEGLNITDEPEKLVKDFYKEE